MNAPHASPPDCDLFGDLGPRSVHAAAVTRSEPGRLLAVCYAFSYETAPDSTLEAATFDGRSWSRSRTIIDLPGLAVGNPVLHTDRDGTVHLFFAAVYGESWTEARVLHARSRDGGRHWTPPRWVHDRPGLMTKTHALVRDDRVLLPVYDERAWAPHVLVAPGFDGPWRLHGDTTARGTAIQPALAPLGDGRLLMLSRSCRGAIYASWSYDGGTSWTASRPTDLANPNSGIDLWARSDGSLVLVHNPDARDRSRLVVSVSTDEGRDWRSAATLASGEGEFSYPCAFEADDGVLHVLYTAQRTHVVHARPPLPPTRTEGA